MARQMANVLIAERIKIVEMFYLVWPERSVEDAVMLTPARMVKNVLKVAVMLHMANVLNVQRILIVQLAKYVWQLTNVEPAPLMTNVKEAKPVWMANVGIVAVVVLAPAVEIDHQLFISISTGSGRPLRPS